MRRMLRIEVNKDNVYDVVKKLEEQGCYWDTVDFWKPTDDIPYDAKFIYVYDDKTITYSTKKTYDADNYMTADEFLSRYNDDNVNHSAHYQGKNECIDVMIAMFGIEAVKHFCMCNAYNYRCICNIEKAEWYESKLIELNSKDK